MRKLVQRWPWLSSVSLMALLAAGAPAARAQEPAEPEVVPPAPEAPQVVEPTVSDPVPAVEESGLEDDRLGRWRLDLEQWVAQPSGLDYFPVVISDPQNPATSSQLGTRHGTHGDPRVHLSYGFRDDIGTFSLTFWSHDDRSALTQFNPGVFRLGEALVPPGFGGVFDDGFADAVTASAQTKTRDLRLDFSRQAFQTKRVSGRWFFGLRQVDHDRQQGARYFALLPGLALALDRPDLDPLPDVASVSSQFSGRGPEFGFEVDLPLGKRFHLSGGVAAAVLRGDLSTQYSSLSRLYGQTDNGVLQVIHGPGIDEWMEEWTQLPDELRPDLQQITIPVNVVNGSRSTSAQVLDTSLAVRFRVWRELEIYGGARTTRYTDVAADARPVVNDAQLIGTPTGSTPGVLGRTIHVPVSSVEEAPRSVDYEGFFLGLGYRY